jgi:5'-nucleotidase / UDP-sugar diphosphatase
MRIRCILTSAKTSLPYLLFLLVFAAPLWGTEPKASQEKDSKVRILLLHVNDSHGHLEGLSSGSPGGGFGGYARLSTAVDEIRQQNKGNRIFLIHAGDEFSKGDPLTTQTKGQVNITLMNALGFDLWVPGNGDYYNGPALLEQRIKEGKFDILTANVVRKDNGKPIAKPYIIKQAGPVRIAFLGLGFIRTEHPSSKPLELIDPIKTAQALVPEIRKKADIVVAITHIGIYDDTRLAESVDGIDIIIGGHTHTTLPTGRLVKSPNHQNVLICQAGEYLKFLGVITLDVKKSNGTWRLNTPPTAKLVPLNTQIKLDPKITALIARETQTTATVPNSPPPNRSHESPAKP